MAVDRLHHSHLGEDHRAAVLGPPASALMAAYMDFGAATYAAIVESLTAGLRALIPQP